MITLTFNDGGMQVNLAQAPQVIGVQLQKWMTLTLAHLHGAVNRNISKGGLIGRRTGTLSRALLELVTVTGDGVVGELWPDPAKAPYGAIQEEGGTIVPKTAQALTIPLAAMLTANGVARGTARQVRDNPGAFGYAATFIPKGHHVIMGKALGKGASVIPLFALVTSVILPARHYLATTLVQEWPWIADQLEAITGDIVQVVFGESPVPA